MPKNFAGGKGHKKFGGKESRSSKHNREIATEFIEDVFAGDIDPEVDIARVTKGYGGGRFDLLSTKGEEMARASLRGVLTLRGKAGPANPVTISMGSFVVVHKSDHGCNIIAVLTQKQVADLKEKLPAKAGFYTDGATLEDEGFDFDRAEEVPQEKDDIEIDKI